MPLRFVAPRPLSSSRTARGNSCAWRAAIARTSSFGTIKSVCSGRRPTTRSVPAFAMILFTFDTRSRSVNRPSMNSVSSM